MTMMTKREAMEKAVELAVAANEEEVAEILRVEIERMNSRNAAAAAKRAEKKAALEPLKEEIVTILQNAGEGMRCKEIAEAMTEDVSTQKITPILTDLVNEGRVKAEVVKRAKVYSVEA